MSTDKIKFLNKEISRRDHYIKKIDRVESDIINLIRPLNEICTDVGLIHLIIEVEKSLDLLRAARYPVE